MKLQFDSNYTGDNKKKFGFPSDNLPEVNKKDPKYFKQATQAILARYLNNQCEIGYNAAFDGRETIQTLRDYAAGRQGSDRYKNYLIGRIVKETGCRPLSTVDINWKPIDILPKKLGDVKGYMQKLKYDVVATAIDPMSVYSKDQIKAAAKLASDDLMRILHIEINEKAGGLAVDPSGELIGQAAGAVPFQNAQQVDSFAAIGGIQLSQEIAMKILLDKTQHDSVASILNDLIIDDILATNMQGRKYYTEPGCDNVLWDHLELEGAIIPWSKYPDFRDATWAGQVKKITIAELRRTSNLEEKEIIEIAKKFNDSELNSSYRLDSFYNSVQESKDQGLGISVLDSIMVEIADVEWLGTTSSKHTSIVRPKDGVLAVNKVDDDYPELSERDKKQGKEIKSYCRQVVYKCKMVVGTDHIFDYGLVDDIPYKKNHKGKMVPVMSYSFMKGSGPSLTEKCIGFVDDANMALLKKRIIIKNLGTGPNIRINQSAFDNVKINGKLQSPADLMALFRDEGFLIVDDKNPWGQQTGSARPIDVVPSDVIQRLQECRVELEFNMRMIEEITGLNAVFSASTPQSETGLGVSKIAVNSTINSIFPLIKIYEDAETAGYNIAAHKWKIKAANMDDSKRDNFATDRAMRYIRIGKEIAWADYGIKLESGVTEDEKLALMGRTTQLADLRRQAGTGGIKPSDELLIFELIRSGNIKLAQLTLVQIEEFRAQEDEQTAQRRYQENMQSQQQAAQQNSEAKQAEIQTEGQIQASVELAKIQAEMQLEELKGKNARILAAQQSVYSWQGDQYKKTVKQ